MKVVALVTDCATNSPRSTMATPMVAFMFWNLKGKAPPPLVANLVNQREVDVLMVAEPSASPAVMLKALNVPGLSPYHYAASPGRDKIDIFARFTADFIRPVYEQRRLTIRLLKIPGVPDVLLEVSSRVVD